MKRIVLFGIALVLLGAGLASAADWARQVTVTMNPTDTSMDITSLGFPKPFTNRGYYYEGTADVHWQKVAFYGAYQTGRSNSIEGGTDFTSPHFNPLSGEQTNITDLALGYQIADTKYTGKLDVAAGWFHIFDDAEISPSTTYEGVSMSAHGKVPVNKALSLDYRYLYLPNFNVGGNAAQNFSARDIERYRLAGEYLFYNKLGLTGGYQSITINLKIKYNQANSTVHAKGWFGGLFYRW